MLNKMSPKNAKELIKKYFGKIVVQIKELDGYYDQNFYVKDKNSAEFVFKKVSSDIYSFGDLDFQNRMITLLRGEGFKVPKIIKSVNSKEIIIEGKAFLRLLSYLPGDIVASNDYNKEILKNVGKLAAETDLALKGFFHPSALREKDVWDMRNSLFLRKHIGSVKDIERRKILNDIIDEYEEKVVPVKNDLRIGVTHNDINEFNLLTKDGLNISGLIDFGDACYTFYVNNLAVSIAHFMLRQNDPIKKGSVIYKAYNNVFPLTKVEKNVLPILVKIRLLTLIIESSYEIEKNPNNDYIEQGIERAWNTLQKIIKKTAEEVLKEFETD